MRYKSTEIPIPECQTKIILSQQAVNSQEIAGDFIQSLTKLSKAKIKEVLTKGGIWLKQPGKKNERIRKYKKHILPGSFISIYYDPSILSLIPQKPKLVKDLIQYSVWNKPAGLLSQGTNFSDHCSILRLAGQHFVPIRKTYPVHRIDRETSGLMVVAHTKRCSALFTTMFMENKIEKKYTVQVKGLWSHSPTGEIDIDIDGKNALSVYKLINIDKPTKTSNLEVLIKTGRTHQIRKHFDMIGHPVMGDPRYGKDNKNTSGLQLLASSLSFQCPITSDLQQFTI